MNIPFTRSHAEAWEREIKGRSASPDNFRSLEVRAQSALLKRSHASAWERDKCGENPSCPPFKKGGTC